MDLSKEHVNSMPTPDEATVASTSRRRTTAIADAPNASPRQSHATPGLEILADLGKHALADVEMQELIGEALSILARTLHTEYSEFWELLADGQTLALSAV